MKIDTSRLKENQTERFEESLLPVQIDLDTDEVTYVDKITITTDAKKEFQVLHTTTHLSARVECRCSRCLAQYANTIERDFDITYPLDQSEQVIDITKDIREEIIANYPVKFLCQPSCKGLCQQCGKNLNEGNCDCQMRTQLTE